MPTEREENNLNLPPLEPAFGPRTGSLFESLTKGKRPGPPTLYHYTNSSGLLGILDKLAIWATSIRFLNDSAEFLRALRLAEEGLESVSPSWTATWERVLEQTIRQVLNDLSAVSSYVFSLSEHDDRLSQWRAYSSGGTGYALGFDMHALFPLIQKRNYLIASCFYDTAQQQDLLKSILDDVHASFEQWIQDTDGNPAAAQSHFAGMFYIQFMSLAPLLKHPSFEEEGEWRVVSPPVWGPDPEVRFRPGRTTIIPYRVFDLTEDNAGRLTELVVGPSANAALALAAATHLKAASSLPIGAVRNSAIPYREV